jgi:hypothetical protein
VAVAGWHARTLVEEARRYELQIFSTHPNSQQPFLYKSCFKESKENAVLKNLYKSIFNMYNCCNMIDDTTAEYILVKWVFSSEHVAATYPYRDCPFRD